MTARLERWLRAPGTPRRLVQLRVLVGGYALGWVLLTSGELMDLSRFDADRYRPVGVVALVHRAPVGPVATAAILAFTALAGTGFVLGRCHRWAAPAFALGLLWLTTYQNSWGKLLHTENLLVLHVLVLAACPPAASRLTGGPDDRRPSTRHGWPVQVLALATVLAYFVAGIAKLRHTGIGWVDPDNLRNWVAYDLVRKDLFGDPYLPIGPFAVEHAWLFGPPALFTLLVELAAPVVLVVRRLALPWLVAAWTLHLAVLAAMSVAFTYQLCGIALLPVLFCSRPPPPGSDLRGQEPTWRRHWTSRWPSTATTSRSST